ncbi:hypothetical protein NMY22_g10659 [Coprinellus aureogranulatus]|nr:hypothetical protein NMY22_g10659 [Coprinellus aureogranulatus]
MSLEFWHTHPIQAASDRERQPIPAHNWRIVRGFQHRLLGFFRSHSPCERIYYYDALDANVLLFTLPNDILASHLVAPRTSVSPDSPETNENKSLDLLVKARTGTGKTIGFLVPAIEARIRQLASLSSTPSSMSSSSSSTSSSSRGTSNNAKQYAQDNIGTLIISPTRELASQIAVEAQKLTSHIPGFQTHLRKDIVVATPGRLRDLIQDRYTGVKEALGRTQMLVLDEADTLLDMGFRDDIEDIITHLPPSTPSSPSSDSASLPGRQTFLFSATVSPSIQSIARQTLHPNHTFINCVSEDTSDVHEHIPQYHTSLPSPSAQLPHLARLIIADQLEFGPKSKVVLFLPTTKQTILFASILNDLSRQLPVFPERRTEIFELHSRRTMQALPVGSTTPG